MMEFLVGMHTPKFPVDGIESKSGTGRTLLDGPLQIYDEQATLLLFQQSRNLKV